ncbi:MAG: cytidine deaminase [Clostridiales bacterium]|nr:cytidine deaminase [Clostridiales bacterium]
MNLNNMDLELLEAARDAIANNYDKVNQLHTVGAAVRCGSGKIYTGVNVYAIHSACAEQVALGTAITNGEREFKSIVAVTGEHGENVIPPCGNCRQILSDYAPECEVILLVNGKLIKLQAKELLPYPYITP